MPKLPELLRDQRVVDTNHLRLLAIFHFVLAGFAVLGLGFLALHYTIVNALMSSPEMMQNTKGGPPPEQFLSLFKWFYLFFGVLLVAGAVVNLLSGLSIRSRKYRVFSIIVAGINCFQFPFGTILGVFTIIVLLRDSVREQYDISPETASQSE